MKNEPQPNLQKKKNMILTFQVFFICSRGKLSSFLIPLRYFSGLKDYSLQVTINSKVKCVGRRGNESKHLTSSFAWSVIRLPHYAIISLEIFMKKLFDDRKRIKR